MIVGENALNQDRQSAKEKEREKAEENETASSIHKNQEKDLILIDGSNKVTRRDISVGSNHSKNSSNLSWDPVFEKSLQ